jgi:hypothetical protein
MKKVPNYFKMSWFVVFFPLLQFGCRSDKSKANHSSTIEVCDKTLFVEKYTIAGGGAHGGDRISDYLTDSINFRMYIGTFDNAHENFTYECKGDSVYIEKVRMEEEGIPYNTKTIVKVIEKKIVDLKMLRKQKKFE